MTIKAKLTLSHLAMLIIPTILLAAALGWVFSEKIDRLDAVARTRGLAAIENDVKEILHKTAKEQITLAAKLKSERIETCIGSAVRDLETLAKSKAPLDFISILAPYRADNMREDGRMNADTDSYRTLRDFKGKALLDFAGERALADLYVVDADGFVLFSATNGPELGERPSTGPLAQAFEQTKATGGLVFMDVSAYQPDGGKPAFFLSAPVSQFKKMRGAVIARLDLSAINAVMADRTGLGERGESYLVGQDGTMRSDSLLAPETHSVAASLSAPQTGSIATPQAKAALAGESGLMEGTNHLGSRVIAAYAPVDTPGTRWGMVVEVDLNEALASLQEVEKQAERIGGDIQKARDESVAAVVKATLAAVGVFTLLGAVLAVLISRALVGPIRKTADALAGVAGGDLDVHIEVKGKDEVAAMQSALNDMAAQLKGNFEEIERSCSLAERQKKETESARNEAEEAKLAAIRAKSEGLLSAAGSLENVVGRIGELSHVLSDESAMVAEGAEDQRNRIAQAAAAMEEINTAAVDMAAGSAEAAAEAARGREHADEGAKIVGMFNKDMDSLRNSALRLSDNSTLLSGRVEDIGRIIVVINDIADQTNLLALNAAIEAARAGDAGRGFAVVADEVRKLAEKTMAATSEVGDFIAAIQTAAKDNISGVRDASKAIDAAAGHITSSTTVLGEIVESSENINDRIHGTAAAAEEQSAAFEEVNRHMESVGAVVDKTSEAMVQIEGAVEKFAEQAELLEHLVAGLKTEALEA